MNTIIVPPLGSKKQSSTKKILIIIGIALGIVFLMIFSFGFFLDSDSTVEVDEFSVLKLVLPSQVSEYGSSKGLFDDSEPLGFYEILETIRKAEVDPRIKGMYIPVRESQMGFVKLEEMLEALRSFKSKGKFIYAYMETASRSDYMMISIADSIFMPKEGLAELSAPGVSALFFKNLLAKVGITMYVQQFEEYKSAGESFSQEHFTPPAKEELLTIIQSRANRMYEIISMQRKLPMSAVKTAFDIGTYTADSLKAHSFIDGIAQEWEVKDKIRYRMNALWKKETSKTDTLETVSMVDLEDYANAECEEFDKSFADKSGSIAIVSAVGAIRSGTNGQSNPFDQGTQEIASGSLIKDLKHAYENEDVKAVILRIDSPGGSVIASDEVWAMIQSLKKKKPIYASMSDVAASGGYYIPMACDTIIAHSQTITGSIGVISIIPMFGDAMTKLGITMDTLSTGASSQDMNLMLPMTESRKKKFYDQMYPIYQRFVSKVANSRKMEFEQARSIAKGRVWLGSDAHQRKLIDTLGGIELAISLAKKRIGIPTEKRAQIVSYPKVQDPLSMLLSSLTGDNDSDEEVSIRKVVSAMLGFSNMEQMINGMPKEIRTGLGYAFNVLLMSKKEQIVALMPYLPQF